MLKIKHLVQDGGIVLRKMNDLVNKMLRYCLFLFLSSDVDFASGNRLLHAN
jgi:hypothetical protein